MFKYLVVLALALCAVMAAPPAPEAAAPLRGPAPVPRDLQTANQLVYGYGYSAVPAYSYGAYPYYSGVYYG